MIRIDVDTENRAITPARETKRALFLELKEKDAIDQDAKIGDYTYLELKQKLAELKANQSE